MRLNSLMSKNRYTYAYSLLNYRGSEGERCKEKRERKITDEEALRDALWDARAGEEETRTRTGSSYEELRLK